MKRTTALIGFLLIFAVLGAGCYTVLNHPAQVAITEQIENDDVQVPCGECHLESEWLGYYDHDLIYGWPGLVAYDGYDWWYDYYRKPWWYDSYWYDDFGRYSDAHPGGPGDPSWQKRALRRGESASDAPSGGLFPGAHRGESGGSSSASPSSGSSGTSSEKKKDPEPTHRKKTPRR